MATLYHSKRKSQTTLNNGGSLSAVAVSVTVTSAAALPAAPYLAYIEPGVVGQEELVAVTGVTSNTLTIIRGLDGTTGVIHPDGSVVKNLTTSLAWEDLLSIFQAHIHTGADNSASIYATPAVALGTAAAAGAANSAIRSNSTIAAFDTTVPVKQAFGDAAATGSINFAARRDHVHGMPLYPSYNILYNGDFSVAQLGTSSQLTNGFVFIDGWFALNTSSATIVQSQLTAPTTVLGPNNLSSYSNLVLSAADVSIAAGDLAGISQTIEGWDGRDIGAYGASFSGWFFSNRTGGGTYSIALRNHDSTWSCVREFTLAANTWTYVTLTFPPPYGTITYTGNMQINSSWFFALMLAGGSTYQTTPNVWTNANKYVGTGQTNNVDNTANVLYMHGLNLVPGQQPQEFWPVPYAQQLARCKRYRQIVATTTDVLGVAQAISTTQFYGGKQFEVEMLGTPTMTLSLASHWSAFNATAGNIALTALSFNPTKKALNFNGTVASGLVAGNAVYIYGSNANALLFAEAYPT